MSARPRLAAAVLAAAGVVGLGGQATAQPHPNSCATPDASTGEDANGFTHATFCSPFGNMKLAIHQDRGSMYLLVDGSNDNPHVSLIGKGGRGFVVFVLNEPPSPDSLDFDFGCSYSGDWNYGDNWTEGQDAACSP